jgi:glycosyltransferase involved in cell wall biosynthesis
MAILFISGLQVDNGQSSSGGNALRGIAEALCTYANDTVELVSYPITPAFPKGKLWIPAYSDIFCNEKEIRFLSTLNLKIIKSKLWGLQSAKYIKDWAKRHSQEELKVLIYNTYHPSIDSIYSACVKVGAKLYAILYDLGVPPKRLGLSWVTMVGYRLAERIAKKYVSRIDGRIIINELIADHYAPGKDYILVDGGINRNVINHLFPLVEKRDKVYTFVLAGMLWDQNGTRLILEAMSKYANPNISIVFAGNGQDVPLIESAATIDKRISYVGLLNMDDLFKLYEKADVLLNLRLEECIDYHFPGKLLEYLATGRYVISTPVAHAERDYGAYMSILHNKSPEGLIEMMDEIQAKGKRWLFEAGIKARQFMLENKTWDVQTKRIIAYMNKEEALV